MERQTVEEKGREGKESASDRVSEREGGSPRAIHGAPPGCLDESQQRRVNESHEWREPCCC